MIEPGRSRLAFGLFVALITLSACAENTGDTVASLAGGWEWRKGDLQSAGTDWQPIDIPGSPGDLEELSGYQGHLTLRRELSPATTGQMQAGTPMSLLTGQLSDVFRVYLNDTLIGQRGSVEPYASGAYRILLVDIPGQAYHANASNYLYFEIFSDGTYPFDVYGPDLNIGPATAVYTAYYTTEMTSLILLAVYCIIGLYHLLLSLRRPRDLYNLYFGLFAVLLSVYWLFTTSTRDVVFGEAVLARVKAEHFALFLLAPPFLLFLSHFFYNRHSRIALGVTAFHGGLALAILPGDYNWVTTLLTVWQLTTPLLALYTIYYIIHAWWRGIPDAAYLILGVVFLMAAGIQDILAIRDVLPTPQVAKYFFLLFLPGIAGILANRFTRVNNEADRLNEELEAEVADRTRDLNDTLKQLQFAKAETDDILHSVQEGLFLIARKAEAFPIGTQHSTELSAILAEPAPAGRDFLELLGHRLHEDTKNNLRKYLTFMFDPSKKARVVNKLNPIRQISVEFPDAGVKHLEFHFSRVLRDDHIVQLMGIVKDVTEATELARQLKLTEEQSRAAAERTQALFNVDPTMLGDFIEDAETEYSTAAGLLDSTSGDLNDTLAELFRSWHTIKGNANLLDLRFIGDIAHGAEAAIERFQKTGANPDEIRAELAPALERLREVLDEIKAWVARLTEFQARYGRASTRSGEYFLNSVRETVQRLSAGYGKQAQLVADDFDYERIPLAATKLTRDGIVQLVRNSIVHGIEPPGERTAANKHPEGTIRLATVEQDGRLQIVLRDDGRGIQVDRLREKAAASGRWPAETVAGWSDGQVARMIFEPGISTAESADLHAGRGVGMDLLKHRWEAADGQIKVAFKPGHFTEFRLII